MSSEASSEGGGGGGAGTGMDSACTLDRQINKCQLDGNGNNNNNNNTKDVVRRSKRFSQPESTAVHDGALRGNNGGAVAGGAAGGVYKGAYARSSKKLSLPLGNALYSGHQYQHKQQFCSKLGSKFGTNDENQNNPEEDDVDEVTRSLESAVRKISRGSTTLLTSPSPGGRSPCNPPLPGYDGLSSSGFLGVGGLSELARGYEQYRESLTFLHPTTEYGEASSDDLSSEWDNSDVESNGNSSSSSSSNNNNNLKLPVSFAVVRRNATAVSSAASTSKSSTSSSSSSKTSSKSTLQSKTDEGGGRKKELPRSISSKHDDDDEEEEEGARAPPPPRPKPRVSFFLRERKLTVLRRQDGNEHADSNCGARTKGHLNGNGEMEKMSVMLYE